MKLLEPGKPCRLPKLRGRTLRLTSVARAPESKQGPAAPCRAGRAALTVSSPDATEASVLALLGCDSVEKSTAEEQAAVQIHARLGGEGAVLAAEGSAMVVTGCFESCGPVDALQASTGAACQGAMEASKHAACPERGVLPEAEDEASARRVRVPTPAVKRPKDVEEYVDLIEQQLRVRGPMKLRALGNSVLRPRGERKSMKELLLQHRKRFVLDLHGCVWMNHARKWRWTAQAAVAKRREQIGERLALKVKTWGFRGDWSWLT